MARKSVRASISKADEIRKNEAPVSKSPSKAEASEAEKNDARRSSRGSRKSGGIPAAFEIDFPAATAAAAAEQDKRGRNGKRASETKVESEAPKKKRAASVKISPEEAVIAEKHSTVSPVAATAEPALTVHAVTELVQDALKDEKEAWASEVSDILEGSLLSSKVKEMIEGQLDNRIEKIVKMHVESIIKDSIKKELELQLVSMKTEMKDAIREIAETEASKRTDVPNAEAEFLADVDMSAAEPLQSVPENDDSVPETPAEEIPELEETVQQEEAENNETELDQGGSNQVAEDEQNEETVEKTSTDGAQNEGESTPEAAGVTEMC
ncbi:hypothetical protein BJ741DRAFT_654189 [Chytriomyces cf. hyalinus JEL632]|nr:hypothetical protein BJ741DRAFT_654189 [Chytriomyces cf. hyalinus JEL632]